MKKQTGRRFSKYVLVKSKRFQQQRDILQAILKEEKQYTLREVEEILQNFKGKV